MATGLIGAIAGEGGDPRISDTIFRNDDDNVNVPIKRTLYDPSVSFDEYRYYAIRTREEEKAAMASDPPTRGIMQTLIPAKSDGGVKQIDVSKHSPPGGDTPPNYDEKNADGTPAHQSAASRKLVITDVEWTNASRAVRTASAAAIFYLITTDILGPFGVGFTMGTLGWAPGIVLFTVFAGMAAYSAYLLWDCFMGLDSYEYPCKNYADLAFRIYGRPLRHLVNFLQSVQLILSVGIIVIGNGQSLSQVSQFKLCYAVCCLLWALCGFGLGQIRTLQKFGILANVAVFINLMIIFITMGVFAHSPPNYLIATLGSAGSAVNSALITPVNGTYPPVIHFNGLPNPNSLVGSLNGLMQAVYAFAGAQLFIEFMAEMKRPRDFLKGVWGAQLFIYVIYMVYGCYTYYFQGQYSYQNSYQGVSAYGWQVVGDMLAIISGLLAATLYGNIGIKVLYNNIFIEFFNAPSLITRRGKMFWAVIVPIYWTIAFIIAASIPNFFGLTSVTAALCLLHFAYTFPPIFAVGFYIRNHAFQEGEGFDPATGQVTRHDAGLKRFIRGFFAKRWYHNVFLILYAGAALATSGLGAYAAIESLIASFEIPQINAFSCTSPLHITPPSS